MVFGYSIRKTYYIKGTVGRTPAPTTDIKTVHLDIDPAPHYIAITLKHFHSGNMQNKLHEYHFMRELQALPYVEEIWLFGSRARGDASERSDIDLAIVCPNATEAEWLAIMTIIEEADTLLKIDCVKLDQHSLSQEFYSNIMKDRKMIYGKNKN